MAFGSTREVEYQLSIAARLGYFPPPVAEKMAHQTDETAKVLAGLLRSLRPSD
jgi:four helix bundle protein